MITGEGNFLVPDALLQLYEHSSLPVIAITIFAGMVISALAGFVIRRVPGRFLPQKEGEAGQEAYVVSAVLGLLALLMGFTFSLALDRYESRRLLVLEEANAIGTAYLRAQLLPDPEREQITATLAEYVDNRITLAGPHNGRFPAMLARNDQLLVDLWAQSAASTGRSGPNPVASLSIASINAVIDLDTSRKTARMAKVPSAVYAVLTIYIMISAAILGYTLIGLWARLAATILFSLITLSLLLIVDIDRPMVGSMRESQIPMELLRDFLKDNPPASLRARSDGADDAAKANMRG